MTECLLGVVGIKPSVQEVLVSLPVKLQIIKHRDQRNQRDHGEMFQRRCRRYNSGSGVDVRMLLEKCKKTMCLFFLFTHTMKHENLSNTSVMLYLWWADEFYWLWKCLYNLFLSLRLELRKHLKVIYHYFLSYAIKMLQDFSLLYIRQL